MAADQRPLKDVSYEERMSRGKQLDALEGLVQAGVLTEAQMRDALAHTFAPRQLAALRVIDNLIQNRRQQAFFLTLLQDPGGRVNEGLLWDLAVVDQALLLAFAGWATRHGVDLTAPCQDPALPDGIQPTAP